MEIFEKKCASCHKVSYDFNKRHQLHKDPTNLAPPMNFVANRLKMTLSSEKEFVDFVVDYIENPSQSKAKCKPKAIKKLGLMPPIGKTMTQDEMREVALWLYKFKDEKIWAH